MRSLKILVAPALLTILISCGGGNTQNTQFFDILISGNKKEFKKHDNLEVSIQSKKGKIVEKVTYSIDGKVLPESGNSIQLEVDKLGDKTLRAVVQYEGGTAEVLKKIKILAPNPPEIYTYEIVNEYPHDINAYTQGLEFYKDTLYESTGQKGKSSLRKVDFKTGKVLKQIDLENSLFGEGITILDNKVYQLTWQNGIGFVYDIFSFEKIDSFTYGKSKEGWGLCNDGEKIFKSDGTEKIWILNPKTLAEEDYIEIVTDKSIFNKANELEYVDGKIYANVYQKESMMIIDAASGAIEGVINFGGLKDKVTKHDALNVLNGVAYHPTNKTFFVTGKNWDKLFEVSIKKK